MLEEKPLNTPLKTAARPSPEKPEKFDPRSFLASTEDGSTTRAYKRGQTIFRQGDAANAIYYIDKGAVKITVNSKQGKEGAIAILGPDAFFGEECLAGQLLRLATASTLGEAMVIRIDRASMTRLLRDHSGFAQLFMRYLLARSVQIESDLVDHLFNSSERRLARVLLLLADLGKHGNMGPVIPKISQDLLAARVGTTRSRINYFMNKFRTLGCIEYGAGLKVNFTLLNAIVQDQERRRGADRPTPGDSL
jgi:CRP-like cAMP-binding protein